MAAELHEWQGHTRELHERMMNAVDPQTLLEAVRGLALHIQAQAAQMEADRRLSAELARSLAELGIFRLMIPRRLGGLEMDLVPALHIFEELAQIDGSTGWCAMIGATGGTTSAFLSEEVAREIYASDPKVITAGALAPYGQARPTDGGYRVSGRWPFNSGCQHSQWLMGTSVIVENGQPRKLPNGYPETRLMIFPATEAAILDTWSVSGLRGSGSHDMTVQDVFVPEERAVAYGTGKRHQSGPLYTFPIFGLLAVSVASVATGMARGAIQSFVELAQTRRLTGSSRPLSQRASVQLQVAQAEAQLRAGRALLFQTVQDVWDRVVAGQTISHRDRALLRLSACHAASASAQAIDLMYQAAGTGAIWDTSPLQRHFRDVHVLTQHAVVAPPISELAGKILLGLETTFPML